jgi:hypothetical protein
MRRARDRSRPRLIGRFTWPTEQPVRDTVSGSRIKSLLDIHFPLVVSIMGSSITLNRLGYSEGHSEFGGFHLVHALRSSSQIQPPSKTSLQHLQNHPDATEPIPYW